MLFQTIKGVQWRQTCSGNKIGQIQVKSDFRGTELAMGGPFCLYKISVESKIHLGPIVCGIISEACKVPVVLVGV